MMRWRLKLSMPEHLDYTSIAPVPEGMHRPYWSVMIPTYNCANYLAQTLKSVLEQDPGPEEMQIAVIDDCSLKDDPEAVVKEIGKGRISFFRQPQNCGAIRNFNTCIERSVGQIVHILHGDDFVLPTFYKKMKSVLTQHPDCGMAVSSCIMVDALSLEIGTLEALSASSRVLKQYHLKMNTQNTIRTPTVAVRRAAYEHLGGFDLRLPHAADWEMWLRICANSSIWYEHDVLAAYRSHPNSDTSRFRISGAYIDENRKTIEIAVKGLPIPNPEEFKNTALFAFAKSALTDGNYRAGAGDIGGAIRMVSKAAQCSPTTQTFWSGFRIMAKAAKYRYFSKTKNLHTQTYM